MRAPAFWSALRDVGHDMVQLRSPLPRGDEYKAKVLDFFNGRSPRARLYGSSRRGVTRIGGEDGETSLASLDAISTGCACFQQGPCYS